MELQVTDFDWIEGIAELINGPRDLVLAGPPGHGKTSLARLLPHAWGRPFQFAPVADLIGLLQQAASYSSGLDVNRTVERLSGNPSEFRWFEIADRVLVLDDMGANAGGDREAVWIKRILDNRYDRGLPTIITTNLRLADLDPRIASRLEGYCAVSVVKHDWRKGRAGAIQ